MLLTFSRKNKPNGRLTSLAVTDLLYNLVNQNNEHLTRTAFGLKNKIKKLFFVGEGGVQTTTKKKKIEQTNIVTQTKTCKCIHEI